MISEVCNLLANKLSILVTDGILDYVAGMTKVHQTTYFSNDESLIDEIPLIIEPNDKECDNPLLLLVPDSNKSGFVFFEEVSNSKNNEFKNNSVYNQEIRLICWYNSTKFNQNNIGSLLISKVINLLSSKITTNNFITSIKLNSHDVISTNNFDIFGKYNFRSNKVPIFDYPFGCFAISINLKYSVNHACYDTITRNNQTCL